MSDEVNSVVSRAEAKESADPDSALSFSSYRGNSWDRAESVKRKSPVESIICL
jgi:hypothetical protein